MPPALCAKQTAGSGRPPGARGGKVCRRAKERLRETFVPRSPVWRRMVIRQSLDLIEEALHADA